MQTTAPTYVIGDVHGQLRHLLKLLHDADLLSSSHSWTGGQSSLWFIGDLVDRGHDSIAVIDLVIRLQKEAAAAGGYVGSVLGNHEMLLLAAYRFGRRSTGLSSNFITKWRQNGGQRDDLAKLTKEHLAWLAALPAMVHVDKTLLIHADSTFYTRYGRSVAEVNETFTNLLQRSNALAWEEMLEEFSMRGVFSHNLAGNEFIGRFLTIFGGEHIVHGHTPIHTMSGGQAKKVTTPFTYANGRCVNVDGGIYLGGPGFLYQLPSALPVAQDEETTSSITNLHAKPLDK